MNNKCRLDDMLNAFVFEEMVEVICLINKFSMANVEMYSLRPLPNNLETQFNRIVGI